MSSLDLDLDAHMNNLETEWRQAYEAGLVAREDYQALATAANVSVVIVKWARDRVDRAEALKARIMAQIERLETSMLGEE
jgi:hypothetical protein